VVNRRSGQKDAQMSSIYRVDINKKERKKMKKKENNSSVSTGQSEICTTRKEDREASARSWGPFPSPNASCYMRIKMLKYRHPECVSC
jgi:hypothetical protein